MVCCCKVKHAAIFSIFADAKTAAFLAHSRSKSNLFLHYYIAVTLVRTDVCSLCNKLTDQIHKCPIVNGEHKVSISISMLAAFALDGGRWNITIDGS